jgi:hypothetical protein
MSVDEVGFQNVSFVLGAGVVVTTGIPGVIKTSQLSEVSFPFASFVGILYLIQVVSSR